MKHRNRISIFDNYNFKLYWKFCDFINTVRAPKEKLRKKPKIVEEQNISFDYYFSWLLLTKILGVLKKTVDLLFYPKNFITMKKYLTVIFKTRFCVL